MQPLSWDGAWRKTMKPQIPANLACTVWVRVVNKKELPNIERRRVCGRTGKHEVRSILSRALQKKFKILQIGDLKV